MTQDEFIIAHQSEWAELDQLLGESRDRGVKRMSPFAISRLAALYRGLSADVARAEGSRFGDDLLAHLERLASRAHALLYKAPPWRIRVAWNFLSREFPRTLRRRSGYFTAASVLFFVPMILGIVGAIVSPGFAERVVPASALAQAADNFGDRYGGGRGAGEGALMTGFYVYNNVGIAFRCFAMGVFFGLGSVFFLVFNGVMIGVVLGYVVRIGHGDNILSFVASHSPFELTAIVISGAAGLQMGMSLVRTHGETRLGSLRRQGPEILRLVLGAAVMLLIAALIEGNYSGSALPIPIKLASGAALTLAVVAYLAFAGRDDSKSVTPPAGVLEGLGAEDARGSSA